VQTEQSTEIGIRSDFERLFEAGAIVFDEGDAGEVLYVIQSGAIELTRSGPDGTRIVDNLGPGEFFGEMSVVLGGTRTVRARAVSHTRLLELDGSTLQAMCIERPEIALRLVRRLAARVLELEKQVFALRADDLLRLVVRALLDRSESSADGTRFPVTLREIGSKAGLSLSEVHEALQKLFDRKILRLADDVLHTNDLAGLEALSESTS
jgi:CRP/FNR family transcriptional regulator